MECLRVVDPMLTFLDGNRIPWCIETTLKKSSQQRMFFYGNRHRHGSIPPHVIPKCQTYNKHNFSSKPTKSCYIQPTNNNDDNNTGGCQVEITKCNYSHEMLIKDIKFTIPSATLENFVLSVYNV